MFQDRPYNCIPVCSSAPGHSDINVSRNFTEHEQASLRLLADVDPRRNHLNVKIVSAIEDRLRVRACHSVFNRSNVRLIATGEEFEISRSRVFSVTLPD
jgi:hypothetical protein